MNMIIQHAVFCDWFILMSKAFQMISYILAFLFLSHVKNHISMSLSKLYLFIVVRPWFTTLWTIINNTSMHLYIFSSLVLILEMEWFVFVETCDISI